MVSACDAKDAGEAGSIPWWKKSPGGPGNPLQYSRLENPMDRGAWRLRSTEPQRVGLKQLTVRTFSTSNPLMISDC